MKHPRKRPQRSRKNTARRFLHTAYDPTKRAGERLSQLWRELFYETRRRFLRRLEDVPEANKAVRVRQLAHVARAFKARENYRGMADMLERIAKEMGNVHTNRREVTGQGGGPLRFDYSDLTDELLDARIEQLLGSGLATGESG